MPLKTFLNLHKERQKEIIDACLEEFILYDYRDASLTRIIRKLNLAKGSFYRYFESKLDLYKYLIEYIKNFNLAFFKESFSKAEGDLMDSWIHYYLSCVRLDKAYPLYSCFGYKITRERNNIVLGNVALRARTIWMKMLRDSFLKNMEKGLIRRDLDVDLMSYALFQLQTGFLDYLTIKYGIDFEKNAISRKPLFSLPEETIDKELRSFAEIMRHGILKEENKRSTSETKDE